jgi:hypothetical protein
MKRLVSAVAAAALLAMPIAAPAQGHGGGHGGGHAGGFHGGGRGFRGGGFGFRGGRGFFPFGLGFGLGLGFALADDPWFYGFPGYGYWDGPCGAWGCGYYYDSPPPAPGPAGGPLPPAACGNWVWHADQGRYAWVPQACAAPGGPPPAAG